MENLWAKPDPISVRERTPEREEWHQRWLQAGRNIENHKKAGQETPKALAVLKDKRKRKVLKNFLKQNRAAHEEMQSWVWHLYHHKGRLGVHGSPRKIKLPLSWYDGESEFESSIVEAIGRNGGIDAYARKYNLW